MSNTSLWTTVKDDLRVRRERRELTRRLRADLSTYRTPSEIEDLLATIDAQDAAGDLAEAPIMRGILGDNLADYYHARRAPMQQAVGL